MHLQMQHQVDRAAAAAAVQQPLLPAPPEFDSMEGMMITYPGASPAAPTGGPRRLTFEDEMTMSSSPRHFQQQQQQLMMNTYPPKAAAPPAAAGYNQFAYYTAGSSPQQQQQQDWESDEAPCWGGAAANTRGFGASAPLSPEGRLTQHHAAAAGGSPVRSAGRGPGSRGSAAPGVAADSQPWFAGGPRAGAAAASSRPQTQQQQQQQQQGAAHSSSLPYGTSEQLSAVEIMAQTKQLEDQLLLLCQEKDELNREYSKMPLGSGKTMRERQRKAQVEARLEELDAQISKTRMALKRLLGR
jgi:hypothetical protein